MSPAELRNTCIEIMKDVESFGFPAAQASIYLTTPKGWKAPPRFPRGRLLQVKEDGMRVWVFNAQRILAWIDHAQELKGVFA